METLYCQCGQGIICAHIVFLQDVTFVTPGYPNQIVHWCPNCTRRLHYAQLHAQPPKRKPRVITTYKPVPVFLATNPRRPWHAPYLEIHLMGIERGMYRDCLLSDGYNRAVMTEWMYERMGLVLSFGLN